MKLYIFPPSSRVLGIVALKNHLALDCELNPIDLGRGDQLTPEYLALNPNRKMPTLWDGEFVLWESNAILFYMAAKRPEWGLSEIEFKCMLVEAHRAGSLALANADLKDNSNIAQVQDSAVVYKNAVFHFIRVDG